MKKTSNDRTLESFKIYPYVTWGLIIGFSVFVYNITQKLEAVTTELSAYSEQTEIDTANIKPPAQN
jgi:hypothetical protein